jgi:hypothetical protein
MKFLNMGSTPEGPSPKTSSLSPVKPVVSGFSSPSRHPPLKDGPPFSTDADPNIDETHFVRNQSIKFDDKSGVYKTEGPLP